MAEADNKEPQDSGWPIDLKRLKQPPLWLSSLLILIGSLLSLFLLLISIVALWRLGLDVLGQDPSRGSEAIRSLLPIAAAAIGLPLIIWRLAILNRQTTTAEIKTNIDRDTLYTSLFSKSVDQLGGTREYKESRQNDAGTIETLTRTSPNIEVRLGAIHSLVRLSEESARDANKIADMLRSYIRENSWYDRDGLRTKIISQPISSSTSWEFSLHRGIAPENVKSEIDEWKNAFDEEANKRQIWGNSLLETRVDVNEAIDSIASVKSGAKTEQVFYECLFSRRKFVPSALEAARFERCTFSNCEIEFPENRRVEFTSCEFIDCVATGRNTDISIERSYLINFRGRLSGKTSLRIARSHIKTLFVTEVKAPLYMNLSFSYAQDVFVSAKEPDTPISLNTLYLVASNLALSNLKLSAESSLKKLALIYGNLASVDMSDLADFEPYSMNAFKADRDSIPPTGLPRPESWSIREEDDEIPF